MTERQIANRIVKIKNLETQLNDLSDQIAALKAEIQAEMQETEHITACGFVVNWVNVVTNRLDTTRIKTELPDIYEKYIKPTRSRRFTISTL